MIPGERRYGDTEVRITEMRPKRRNVTNNGEHAARWNFDATRRKRLPDFPPMPASPTTKPRRVPSQYPREGYEHASPGEQPPRRVGGRRLAAFLGFGIEGKSQRGEMEPPFREQLASSPQPLPQTVEFLTRCTTSGLGHLALHAYLHRCGEIMLLRVNSCWPTWG